MKKISAVAAFEETFIAYVASSGHQGVNTDAALSLDPVHSDLQRGPLRSKRARFATGARPGSARVIDLDCLEQQLADRARRGERQALEQVVRRELPRVQSLLTRLLGRRQDLEDLTQEVFLQMCRAFPGFRGDSKISTFVCGITVNVARQAVDASASDRYRTELRDELQSEAAGPHRATVANEQLRRLRQILTRLTSKKRVAFLLWAVDGLTPKEIGEITRASVSAVRSRIFYAQKELKRRAKKDPYLSDFFITTNG